MEMWRVQMAQRPSVLSGQTLIVAVLLHFLLLGCICVSGCLSRNEPIEPKELTVVVVENLDGNEDEPPPLEKPTPPPPPPPKPVVQPKPDPVPEKVHKLDEVVEAVKPKKPEPKKKVEKKPEPPKKVEPPKEQPKPQKTKEELLKERIEKMQKSAKNVNSKTVKVQPNGKTAKKTLSDAEIRKLLNQGYKPGRTTQLANGEESRCLSLIKMAFESKWSKPAYSPSLRPMVIHCVFGPGGVLRSYHLTSGSGDSRADQSILDAARLVGRVNGLSAEFIAKYSGGIDILFKVEAR